MNNKYPILWSFRRCPYAMRARLSLYCNNFIVEIREISLKHKPDKFLSISPKGTVPVLQLEDGKIIDESNEIINWAIEKSNDYDCWKKSLEIDKIKTKEFLIQLDTKFKSDLDRYKYSSRYKTNPIKYRESGKIFLNRIEEILNKQNFLSGNKIGLLDYSTLPFVRQFRIADIEWFDQVKWPKLHNWLNKFLNSNLFNKIMRKYELWDESQITLFGKKIN